MQSKRIMAILACTSAALLWNSNAHASEVQWIKSYDSGKTAAQARGSLMMLDFYTDW